MEGCFSSESSYEEWKAKRQFIAEVVNADGSILDVGCANGFLLRSLQEWTGRHLTPFGIDVRDDLIFVAKELFPGQRNNFAVLDVSNIDNLRRVGLPDQFDFIYWNFLGSWNIGTPKWGKTLRTILRLGTRRVILGFYGTNGHLPYTENWHIERARLLLVPSAFERAGFTFSGFKINPTAFNQVVGWFDL